MKQSTMEIISTKRNVDVSRYLKMVGAAIVLSLSCSSCGQVSSSLPIYQFNEIDSSHAVAAMYFTPYAPDRKEDDKSYIVFMNPDGSYHLVPTENMGYGSIDWGKNGIYFSGPLREYWYQPGDPGKVTSLPSHKVSLNYDEQESEQNGLFPINGGEHYLSFINGGFTNEEINGVPGYEEQVVTSGEGDTSKRIWKGGDIPSVLADCGNTAYAVTSYEKEYISQNAGRFILYRVFHNGNFDGQKMAEEVDTLTSHLAPVGRGVCVNNTIMWLSRGILNTADSPHDHAPASLPDNLFQPGLYPQEKAIMMIVKWNTQTGKREFTPLTNSSGRRFTFDNEYWILMNEKSVNNNKLYWVEFGTGKIYSTNIETGNTQKLAEISDVKNYTHAEVLADFTDTQIITMVAPQTSDSRDVFVEYFDKSSGKRTKRIVMKGLNRVRKQVNALPYGFTVNPEEK